MLDTETKVKIGEGVRYEMYNGEERKRKGLLNKPNCINMDYSKTKLESSTGEPFYNAVLTIVDLRKTVLTNKGY